MKTTTTETMKYGPAGELIERVTVVEIDDKPRDKTVSVVQHIHNPESAPRPSPPFPGSSIR